MLNLIKNYSISIIGILILSSCSVFQPIWDSNANNPMSLGEEESGYTYIPIDPIPISQQQGNSCKKDGPSAPRPLLRSFPDNAVRISVEKFDSKGGVTYGSSGIGASGDTYRVTVDYINADSTTIPLYIRKLVRDVNSVDSESLPVPLTRPARQGEEVFYEVLTQNSYDNRDDAEVELDDFFGKHQKVNIPLYVGIGLRVTSKVDVLKANARIEGLGIIGAEAEVGKLSGSLVVQTLGVNGRSISAALPIQSELNRTTAQNAIVSIGSIKALLYEDETIISPRLVGIYLPFPGGQALVNSLISALSEKPIPWYRPCDLLPPRATP